MGQSCALLNTALQARSGTDGVTAASCSGSSSCTCTVTGVQTEAETGTYTTAGTEMTLTDSAGSTDGGPYCVQGSTLHLLTVDTTMAMAKIQSDMVFTK
jgi:Fe-S-cluster-containing hydrogenase component 2